MNESVDNMDLAYAAESLSKLILPLAMIAKNDEIDIVVKKIIQLVEKIG
jgi:hypothetical protein